MPTLLIRADAGTAIGIGHVMRMLALGQAWRGGGGRVVFVTSSPPRLVERLVREGFDVRDAAALGTSLESLAALALHERCAWIALDGYMFDAAFTAALRRSGLRVLQMDDHAHQPTYNADLLVNQNPGAETLSYAINPDGRLLLGPRYALLRQEFLRHAPVARALEHSPLRILVTFGGADPENFTLRALEVLDKLNLSDLAVMVLVGAANPHRETLVAFARRSALALKFRDNVEDMATCLFEETDVAFASASSTWFELAYAGVPAVLVQTAANQRMLSEAIRRGGEALVLPEYEPHVWSKLLRGWLSDRKESAGVMPGSVVDGRGGRRIMDEMRSACVTLRPATPADKDDLFHWRNHLSVRNCSRQREEIPYADHCRWFSRVLEDPNRFLLIATVGDITLGVIRLDRDRLMDKAEISVYLVPAMQGQGWGVAFMLAGLRWCKRNVGVSRVVAEILPENIRSIRMCEEAGFMRLENELAVDFRAQEVACLS